LNRASLGATKPIFLCMILYHCIENIVPEKRKKNTAAPSAQAAVPALALATAKITTAIISTAK